MSQMHFPADEKRDLFPSLTFSQRGSHFLRKIVQKGKDHYGPIRSTLAGRKQERGPAHRSLHACCSLPMLHRTLTCGALLFPTAIHPGCVHSRPLGWGTFTYPAEIYLSWSWRRISKVGFF